MSFLTLRFASLISTALCKCFILSSLSGELCQLVERINKNRVTVLTRKSDLKHAKQGKGDTGLVIFLFTIIDKKKVKKKKTWSPRGTTRLGCVLGQRGLGRFFTGSCVCVC
jgi:hypothetical protein